MLDRKAVLDAYRAKTALPEQRQFRRELNVRQPKYAQELSLSGVKHLQIHHLLTSNVIDNFEASSKPSHHTLLKNDLSDTNIRLSQPQSFTHCYRGKVNNKARNVSGDYIQEPIKATKLLRGSAYSQLNLLQRSPDFNANVKWRMLLRPEE
jgi:hypothetical protein